MCERHVNIYEEFVTRLKSIMTATVKIIEGYLPPEIFTPTQLKRITEAILYMVQKAHPAYVLALPHFTQNYNMKIITFEVENSYSLVVTLHEKAWYCMKLKQFQSLSMTSMRQLIVTPR